MPNDANVAALDLPGELRATVDLLNRLLMRASHAGLRVELTPVEVTAVGDAERGYIFTVRIYKAV